MIVQTPARITKTLNPVCDRCDNNNGLFIVQCYMGCWHTQCLMCAKKTESEQSEYQALIKKIDNCPHDPEGLPSE